MVTYLLAHPLLATTTSFASPTRVQEGLVCFSSASVSTFPAESSKWELRPRENIAMYFQKKNSFCSKISKGWLRSQESAVITVGTSLYHCNMLNQRVWYDAILGMRTRSPPHAATSGRPSLVIKTFISQAKSCVHPPSLLVNNCILNAFFYVHLAADLTIFFLFFYNG